jgi:hypothetical protein
MSHFCVLIDGDPSLFERSGTCTSAESFAASATFSVEKAVTGAFAALSNIMTLSGAGSDTTFTAYTIGQDSVVQSAQVGLTAPRHIAVDAKSRQEMSAVDGAVSSATGSFYSAINLSKLLSMFVKHVEGQVKQHPAAPCRAVALLGRAAGVVLGDEEELKAALISLKEMLLGGNSTVIVSFNIVLLPRPVPIIGLSAAAATADPDYAVCHQFAAKLSAAFEGTDVLLGTHVVRARDNSHVGGQIARAFLDHANVR